MNTIKHIILIISPLCYWSCSNVFATEPTPSLLNPYLVNQFYDRQPGWFVNPTACSDIRTRFLQVLDSTTYLGLDKEKYLCSILKKFTDTNGNKLFADALITYSKDLYQGANLSRWIIDDEISQKYIPADDSFILDKLTAIQNINEFNATLASLEPTDIEYLALKEALKTQMDSPHTIKVNELSVTLNLYRWIRHFHFQQFIIVNIPSATLRYFENGNEQLEMKVVVGKPNTRTPRFSAYCNEVILYPYWNVPHSIAVKELLPKIKKRGSSAVDAENMQVITKGGKVVDHHSLNWSQYNGTNFPYIFRQCTGCDNALGVIKFNLTDPFDVYMHDTNFKKAFSQKSRFLSHGCIRLEKPIELGNLLLDNKLDTDFVRACIEGQTPIINKLKQPVPVFVIYMPATVDKDNKVVFLKDTYHIFK